MKLLSECRLYTFVDTAYLRGRDARTVARQLCDGGLRVADCVGMQAIRETNTDHCGVLVDAERVSFEGPAWAVASG